MYRKLPKVIYFVSDKNTLIKKAVKVLGIFRTDQGSVTHPVGNIFSLGPLEEKQER